MPRKLKSRRHTSPSSSSSSEEEDIENQSPAAKPRAAKGNALLEDSSDDSSVQLVSRSSRKGNQKVRSRQSDLLESSSDEDSQSASARRCKSKPASRTKPRRKKLSRTDSSDKRKSPRRRTRRPSKSIHPSSEDSDVSAVIPKTWRAGSDSDEDFVENHDGDLEIDELADDLRDDSDSSDSEKDEIMTKARRKSVQTVDSDGIGSAEESSDGGTEPYRSPQLELKKKSLRRSPIYDTDSDNSDDYHVSPSKPRLSLSPPKLPPCSSTVDSITAEPLPAKHVCFISPDGSSRQCFLLSTLRRVALTTPHKKYRQDLAGNDVEAFLQPPHFRSIMSDDLLDQIASRFGRDATDLHSEYYKKNVGQLPQPTVLASSGREAAREKSFAEMLKDFMMSNMGSTDLYVCPLCYTVSNSRIGRVTKTPSIEEGDSEQVKIEKKYPLDFRSDPMWILGNMDREKYQVASLCSFTKVSKVKEHLRDDHHVATNQIVGSDLYQRFKVRATDGLLQRYIKLTNYRTFQGQLQQYWFEGNNELFVLLLSSLHSADRCRELINDPNHDEFTKAEDYWLPALAYFESFENDAAGLWDYISAPYQQVEEGDIDDFIGDDDVASDGAAEHRALAMAAERERIEEERADLMERYQDFSEQEVSSSDDSSEDVAVLEISSSSSEDEWTKTLKSRKRPSLGSSQKRRRLSRLKKGSPQGGKELVSSGQKRRALTLEDSDSD